MLEWSAAYAIHLLAKLGLLEDKMKRKDKVMDYIINGLLRKSGVRGLSNK